MLLGCIHFLKYFKDLMLLSNCFSVSNHSSMQNYNKKLSINLSCLLLAGLLVTTKLFSVDSEPAIWTPVTAMQQAIETNPSILEARAQFERQTGVLIHVRSTMLPTAEIVGSANTRDRSLIDTAPSRQTLTPAQQTTTSVSEKSYNVGLEFRQLVFDGFTAFNQYREHKYLKDASYWNLVNVTYRILSLVQQAYDGILMNKAMVEIHRQSVETFRKIALINEKRAAVGDVTSLDGLRVNSELKRAEADLAAAQSALVRSEEEFRKLLQIPVDSANERPVFAEGVLEQRYFLMTPEEALKRAEALQPEIISARKDVHAAKMRVYSAQGNYLPKIDAFAKYNMQSSFYDFDKTLDGWILGIQGRWTLFDSFGREGTVKADKASLRASRIRLEDKRYQIASQVRELYAQMDAIRQSIESQREAVRFGAQSVREGERLYAVGMAGIEILLDAELSLRRSQIDLQARIFENNRFVYELEYVIGTQWVDPFLIKGTVAKSK